MTDLTMNTSDGDMPEHIMARARDLTHLIYCEVDDSGRPYIPSDEILTIACSIFAAVQDERAKCIRQAEITESAWELDGQVSTALRSWE